MQATPPEIPDKFIEFARAVAELARMAEVSQFELKIQPTWRDEHGISLETRRASNIQGSLSVVYNSLDSRGRPCTTLTVFLNAEHRMFLRADEPSSD